MMMGRLAINLKCKRLFSALAVMVLCVCMFSPLALAAPPAPADSACDPEYYKTLNSRAWLEAQREITQNQNLIFKPDSVLQYTCFDKHLGVVAEATKTMFSEGAQTDGNSNIARAFVSGNFTNDPDKALGGRSENQLSTEGIVSQGNNNNNNQNSATYSCDAMNKVWKEARCMNFVDEADSDAFFTLAEYVSDSEDKRFKKGYCPKSPNWQKESDAVKDPQGWEKDDIETFLERFNIENCGKGGFESAAIPTGIKVLPDLFDETGYDEHFCLIPGCYAPRTRANTTPICQPQP